MHTLKHSPHSRQVSVPDLTRAVAADQPQWILLKANNRQQSSDGCADFNAWLESDLVLIINFNSTLK